MTKVGKETVETPPPLPPDEQFLSIDDAAKFAGGISPARIRAALLRRELRRFKAGPGKNARTLVALSDLRRFIREA